MDTAAPVKSDALVPLSALFAVFLKMGMASFGGGLSGWMHREIVLQRGWIDDRAFLTGVALGQVMPGPNSVNLAIFIGQRLRGAPGVVVAFFGMLTPPFVFILLLAALYTRLGGAAHPGVHFVLSGIAAAGIGLTAVLGIRGARRIERASHALVAFATFIAVGVLHWPTIPVVLVVVPISILLAR